jgi:hypothetical protein
MEILQNKDKKPTLDLTGGESVYCINESQMRLARKLIDEDAASHANLNRHFRSVVEDLTRNEQAALAFLVIDHLNNTPRS